jgi:hypothetical protein
MEPRQELDRQVDVAVWEWLKPHNERGALIVVAGGLSLVEVGERLAADDTATVASWLADGRIARPSAEQCVCWDAKPSCRFAMLVISPYVLVQPLDQEA